MARRAPVSALGSFHISRGWWALGLALTIFAAIGATAPVAQAQTQIPVQKLAAASSGVTAQDQVDGANGSFQQTIPIEVPPFFGIEPKLALTYESKVGNGPLGMGWRVGGLSVIQRASPGRGAPTFDGNDVYLLDGQQLTACTTGMSTTAASCAAGGTHTTRVESFLRIVRNGGSVNNWFLRMRNGTRLTYLPIAAFTGGTLTLAPAQRGGHAWQHGHL